MILTNGKIAGYLSCSEHIKDKSVSMIDDIIKSIQKVSNIEYEPINYSAEIFDVFFFVKWNTIAITKTKNKKII